MTSKLQARTQHTKFREEQTGHAIRDTCHMATREDTISLVVNPPQQPRAVLSNSHSMVSLPQQVHQMFKMRDVEHARALE